MTAFGIEVPYPQLNPEELMIAVAIFIIVVCIMIAILPLLFSKTKSTEVK